jgi:hypothetical protein
MLSVAPVAASALGRRTDIYRAIYGQTTPGARWHIDEAIRANVSAGVWGMASGWTAEQLSRCMIFQDSAGTLPVFAPEQPIGLVLDCRYAPGSRGVELVVNGGFDVDTSGWAQNVGLYWTAVGGRAFHPNINLYRELKQSFVGLTGTYEVQLTLEVSSGSMQYFTRQSSALVTTVRSFGIGTHNIRFIINDLLDLGFSRAAAGGEGYVDNISVREIPGLPLTQSSTMARPAASARVNLVNNSEFTLGAVGATALDYIVRGSVTANKVLDANSPSGFAMQIAVASGGGFASTSDARVAVTPLVAGAGVKVRLLVRKLSGSVLAVSLPGISPSDINPATGGGYEWVELNATPTGTSHNIFFGSSAAATYNIAAIDIRLSVNATPALPAYQRVTTASDYDAAGFVWKAVFNGTNQWMQHAALDMTSTDEVTVWASLLKESDAATAVVYESSGESFSGAGKVMLTAPNLSPDASVRFRSRGTQNADSDAPFAAFPAPRRLALIGRGDISADISNLSVAGTQVASNANDQGTGNYGNHLGFIGARAGTSLFFKGELYELGIAGKVITDGQLQSLNNRMTRSAKI